MIFAKYAHPNNGSKYQQVEINSLLKVKKHSEVDKISMDECKTTVHLRNIMTPFNAVFFDFFEDGKQIDIYTDPRFNSHIRESCHAKK